MLTADLALKFDPEYRKIAERFLANPEEYRLAFAKAWYNLTHRDMGPRSRYLGSEIPSEAQLWEDPIPSVDFTLVNDSDITRLKREILNSGLSVQELIRVAWASASTYRESDHRGGANGARIALAPQKDWAVNNPAEVAKVVGKLREIQEGFNGRRKQVSLADLIVLGGAAAIEKAAADAGVDVDVPFAPGRGDALQAQTDVPGINLLKPRADAFRNYFNEETSYRSPTEMLVDKADQLDLTVPEMTVLLGGLRSLGANANGSNHGVFTDQPGTLNNDFFVNLLDMSTKWRQTDTDGVFEGVNRSTCLLYTSPSPRDLSTSRMPSSA